MREVSDEANATCARCGACDDGGASYGGRMAGVSAADGLPRGAMSNGGGANDTHARYGVGGGLYGILASGSRSWQGIGPNSADRQERASVALPGPKSVPFMYSKGAFFGPPLTHGYAGEGMLNMA